mmetsp:Transcript_67508/g.195166  ORF Transcript_67508/g.195166 Transcript_67508/m.195166 type:complete len:434 (-) Transcript_67508:64-1365(-)
MRCSTIREMRVRDLVLLAIIFNVFPMMEAFQRPFLRRDDLCGIWKVGTRTLDLPNACKDDDKEVVIRLNDDGTFDPYTPIEQEEKDSLDDDLSGILGRGGCWEYRDETLMLALDRPENADSSKVHDMVLVGKLDVHVSESLSMENPSSALEEEKEAEAQDKRRSQKAPEDIDVHLSIPKGRVSIGKFMYPKKHKAFFDEPMLFKRSNIGTFHMNQVLGNLNARLKEEREAPPKPEPKYKKEDFFNRTFYLTTAPHPVNPTFAELDVHYDESKATMDIRVLPVTFYPNSTFAAIGTEKILRGKYEISGEQGDQLYFRVSLFGFGRSAPGSVYSEGRLLNQDDRRAYLGSIQAYDKNNQTCYFVDGEFYYGAGKEALRKPNSMGTFTLQEIDGEIIDEGEDDEDDSSAETEISLGISSIPVQTDVSWDDIEDAFQ